MAVNRLQAMHAATFQPDDWQLNDRHYEMVLSNTYAILRKSYKDKWILSCETKKHISRKRGKGVQFRASSLANAKSEARRIALAFNAEVAG